MNIIKKNTWINTIQRIVKTNENSRVLFVNFFFCCRFESTEIFLHHFEHALHLILDKIKIVKKIWKQKVQGNV